jgi:hypothetical protein
MNTVETLLVALQERGLAHWYSVVLDFAGRWDGWRAQNEVDETLEPDHLPMQQVIDAVLSLQHLPQATPLAADGTLRIGTGDIELADALSRIDATLWHSAKTTGYPDHWNPLIQPFIAFRARSGAVQTWADDKTPWPPSLIQVWLLGRLASEMARREQLLLLPDTTMRPGPDRPQPSCGA